MHTYEHKHEHTLILKKATCKPSLLAQLLQHILSRLCKTSLMTKTDEQVVFLALFLSSRGEMSAHRECEVQGMQHSGAPYISGKRRARSDKAQHPAQGRGCRSTAPMQIAAARPKQWSNLVVPEPEGCCVAAINSPQQREG